MKITKRTFVFTIAGLLILVYAITSGVSGSATSTAPIFDGPYKVVWVIDGDTIAVQKGENILRVRFLCVDTPESVHPDRSRNTEAGKLASEYTKNALQDRWVILEYEGSPKEDRYGRVLAYIHINFNVELVKQGHSDYYTKYGASKRYDTPFKEAAGR